jgi:hypothetical protein
MSVALPMAGTRASPPARLDVQVVAGKTGDWSASQKLLAAVLQKL